MISLALFSGPATIWEGLLVMGVLLVFPALFIVLIGHLLIRTSRFYREYIKVNGIKKLVYYSLLFVFGILFWMGFYELI